VGCVALDDLRRVKKESWDTSRVRDIMTPSSRLVTVTENEPAMKALQLMNANRTGMVFVLDDTNGKFSGVITRSDVVRAVQVEESVLGGRIGGVPMCQVISVDQGMLFELEAPRDDGAEWSALFNSSEFVLIEQKILQLSDGGQSNQFTFQPLQKGRFFITLSQNLRKPAKQDLKVTQKQVKYTIVAN
jgi:hypothetical protein